MMKFRTGKHRSALCAVCFAAVAVLLGGCAGNTEEKDSQTQGVEETAGDTAQMTETETEEADGGEEAAETPVRIYGTIQEVGEDTLTVENESGNASSGEIILTIDPESTFLVNGQTGLPTALSELETGYFEAYVGPVMTLSLPPRTTPKVVIAGLSQEDIAPQYVEAAKDAVPEEGVTVLEGTDGSVWEIPEDTDIQPFRTRNIVTAADITEGRGCLIWQDAQGAVTKVVLFEN